MSSSLHAVSSLVQNKNLNMSQLKLPVRKLTHSRGLLEDAETDLSIVTVVFFSIFCVIRFVLTSQRS